MGEFEVLKDLDVRVPNHEIAVLLGPALFQRPVLTTLDTSPFHHPITQNDTLLYSKIMQYLYYPAMYLKIEISVCKPVAQSQSPLRAYRDSLSKKYKNISIIYDNIDSENGLEAYFMKNYVVNKHKLKV